MKKTFKNEVSNALDRHSSLSPGLIKEEDLSHLPQIVKKYLEIHWMDR